MRIEGTSGSFSDGFHFVDSAGMISVFRYQALRLVLKMLSEAAFLCNQWLAHQSVVKRLKDCKVESCGRPASTGATCLDRVRCRFSFVEQEHRSKALEQALLSHGA